MSANLGAEGEKIVISPDMLAFVRHAAIEPSEWPADPVGIAFRYGEHATLDFDSDAAALLSRSNDLLLVVSSAVCRNMFETMPEAGSYHLPTNLRTIALAVRDCQMTGAVRKTLRGAKCIELFCETFTALLGGEMVPVDSAGEFSELDTRRIVAARRLIDERWHEKLTLESIARACGLNRAKLTRGFRAMFDCTIADAIAERRLGGARQMLLATDLPVSSIGYKCGYLNNASFARAFSRRFGVAPTRFRAHKLAA